MRKFLLILNLLVCFVATSQTTLERGDIMVLGVNAANKNNNCNSNNSLPDYDNIYFVSFKEIGVNTTFEITDNRYINGNNFGSDEGFIRFKRTGSAIPAGTVFKVDFPYGTIGTGTVLNGWTIDYIDTFFGLSNDGDQFFIFQNATWNTSGSVSGSNLKYLLGYNTKMNWSSNSDGSNSLLPLALNCHHISSPINSNKRYRYYNGLNESISQGEWLVRILNSNNWNNSLNNNLAGCNSFQSNVFTGTLAIRQNIPETIICPEDDEIKVINESNIVSWQWYRNMTASYIGSTPISGATNYNYTPNTADIGTFYFYCVMTIDLPFNGASYPSCPINSGFFKVTVNPNPITSPVIPL